MRFVFFINRNGPIVVTRLADEERGEFRRFTAVNFEGRCLNFAFEGLR